MKVTYCYNSFVLALVRQQGNGGLGNIFLQIDVYIIKAPFNCSCKTTISIYRNCSAKSYRKPLTLSCIYLLVFTNRRSESVSDRVCFDSQSVDGLPRFLLTWSVQLLKFLLQCISFVDYLLSIDLTNTVCLDSQNAIFSNRFQYRININIRDTLCMKKNWRSKLILNTNTITFVVHRAYLCHRI